MSTQIDPRIPELIAALGKHGRKPVILEIDVIMSLTLASQLGIALKHPENVGHGAQEIRGFLARLEIGIGSLDPVLAEAIARARKGDQE